MQSHMSGAMAKSVPSLNAAQAKLEAVSLELEKDAYQILSQKFDFDTQSYKVWIAKMSSHQVASRHQQNEWTTKVNDNNMKAAVSFMQNACSSTIFDTGASIATDVLKDFAIYRATTEKRLQLPKDSSVPDSSTTKHNCDLQNLSQSTQTTQAPDTCQIEAAGNPKTMPRTLTLHFLITQHVFPNPFLITEDWQKV